MTSNAAVRLAGRFRGVTSRARVRAQEKRLFELHDCRLDKRAFKSFEGGTRGFWLIGMKLGEREVELSGPCISRRLGWPAVRVVAFKDSVGWVAKFIEAPAAVAVLWVRAYGGRVVWGPK